MRRIIAALLLTGCFLLPCGANAQEKEKAKPAEQEKKPEYWRDSALLRLQVVFAEFDGDKKVSSLPYKLVLHSNAPGRQAALRMGLRVPVEVHEGQFQYMDVGTNLDGHVDKTEDGRFQLNFSVERSSLYLPPDSKAAPADNEPPGEKFIRHQPIVQKFQGEINVLIRDGQTIESMAATDPVTGHTLHIELTLNVLK
jgi:hypothetical protein